MKYAAVLLAGLFSLSMAPKQSIELCEGFFPKNNIIIPMGLTNDGISEQEFNQVLDRLEKVYTPIIAAKGGKLVVERDWTNGEFNAYANQSPWAQEWVVHFFGGMARAKGMTIEGFTIVTCHEMGHHIGGAPKVGGFMGAWASNEGQSDYFATLRCLKEVWPAAENANYVANKVNLDPLARKACTEAHTNVDDQNICMRGAMGGLDLTGAFNTYLREEKKKNPPPLAFDTPNKTVVTKTDNSHPEAQCRLDTYFQGALCGADTRIALDDRDPSAGTCNTSKGDKVGVRPLCWYKP